MNLVLFRFGLMMMLISGVGGLAPAARAQGGGQLWVEGQADGKQDAFRNLAQRINSLSSFLGLYNLNDPAWQDSSQHSPLAYRLELAQALIDTASVFASDGNRVKRSLYDGFRHKLALYPLDHPLTLAGGHIYARTVFQADFEGKNVEVTLVLRKVGNQDGSRWQLEAVTGDILQLAEFDPRKVISPNSSDLNFIHLSEPDAAGHTPSAAWSPSHTYDRLSVFHYLTGSGKLRLQSARSVEIWVTALEGWAFCLEEVEREAPPAGWVITDYLALDSPEKLLATYLLPRQ